MKFGFLLEQARAAGTDFELFATGHYARIEDRNGIPTLQAGGRRVEGPELLPSPPAPGDPGKRRCSRSEA